MAINLIGYSRGAHDRCGFNRTRRRRAQRSLWLRLRGGTALLSCALILRGTVGHALTFESCSINIGLHTRMSRVRKPPQTARALREYEAGSPLETRILWPRESSPKPQVYPQPSNATTPEKMQMYTVCRTRSSPVRRVLIGYLRTSYARLSTPLRTVGSLTE